MCEEWLLATSMQSSLCTMGISNACWTYSIVSVSLIERPNVMSALMTTPLHARDVLWAVQTLTRCQPTRTSDLHRRADASLEGLPNPAPTHLLHSLSRGSGRRAVQHPATLV